MSYMLVVGFTVASFVAARANQGRLTLPVLCTLGVYFPYLLEIQKGFLHGFALLIFWCLCQSILTILVVYRNSDVWASRIWKAESYSESMFRWIRTGVLPEGDRVIRFHLKQTAVFCLLALFTFHLGALLLGCLLLNYMNFYVARLAAKAGRKGRALAIGWNPWSVIRVFSFLYLGAVISSFSLWLVMPLTFHPPLWWLIPGLLGVGTDIVLKRKISASWSRKIREELSVSA